MIEIYILEIILWLAVLFSLTSGIVYMRRLWNRNRSQRTPVFGLPHIHPRGRYRRG